MRTMIATLMLAGSLLGLAANSTFTMGALSPGTQIDSSIGLSNNFVLCLALDGNGYVWAGTENGLNRIAAGNCTAYRHLSHKSTNVRGNGNKVLALHCDQPSGLLFVGTEKGLVMLDYRSGSFVNTTIGDSLINFGATDIVDDHRQGVWVVYDGGQVQHIDCATKRVTTMATRLHSGISSAMDDGHGRLYLGHSNGGMTIVNNTTGLPIASFTYIKGKPGGIPGNNVRCIRQDNSGHIWVGTDHGLAQYNPHDNTFIKVRHAASNFDDNVYDIRQMYDGMLWVACDVGGVSLVDQKSLAYIDSIHIPLSSSNSRALLQDSYGNVWVGSHTTGIEFLSSKPSFIRRLPYRNHQGRYLPIFAIASDNYNRLWVNGNDELSLWQGDTQLGAWRISGMRNRAHSLARSMMLSSDGYVWMGMEDEGVIRFNTHTKRFEHIDIGYDAPDIHSFFEDSNGRVWIGSQPGVCVYHNGIVTHMTQIDRLTRHAPVNSFLRLSPTLLLMATQGNGLLLYNEATGTGKAMHSTDGLPTENINQAIADGNGGLWLATNQGIVHILDAHNLSGVKCYNTNYGLTDNQVQAIILDSKGLIWASTFTSIVCLDITDDNCHIHNYKGNSDFSVGGFATGAVASTNNGTLAFASSFGLYYLRPEDTNLLFDTVHPKIAACFIYHPTGETTGENTSAQSPGNSTNIFPDTNDLIKLNYKQNTIRLTVTTDNYAQAGFIDYSYMMKGLDDKWYDVGDDQEVVFRNLNPGRYTFILRAKLMSQDWANAVTTRLNIQIRPPFYLSWWAYTLYAIIAALWIWYILRSYKRKLAMRSELQLEKLEMNQKQQLNEERLRFFTNITHELRTPLTLILGPLEDLADDSHLNETAKKKIVIINKSAQRLRDLINQILEFRKTETQNRRLTVARGDIGLFVRELVVNYAQLNSNPQVEILQTTAPSLPPIYFDSEVITTIVSNFLSNAVKYTEHGRISVSVDTDTDDHILISVADTGHGIAPEALPHIFERYYQAKGSHQASGTGIGLALAKSLADLHEAQLSVESQLGQGSRFTLLLSASNNYPSALHKEDEDSQQLTAKSQDTNDEISVEQLPQLLIVEDNDDIRQYIADFLLDEYRVLQAANGAQGLTLAQEHIPDIIVSDVMMPHIDGIALTRRLKHDIRTSHIPIILLTAKVTDEDKETGYDSGADSYLTKPFTAKLLNSRIRNLLANRRRMAEQLTSEIGTQPIHHTTLHTQPTSDNKPQPIIQSKPDNELQLSPIDREFIDKLNLVIEQNILQKDIDMALLTDKMAMSHSTFYRKVKALTGLTANEYVRKLRLRYCYRLLESGNYNVTEAATMTGFNQMAHFRDVFKKEFGMLPSEVRTSR